MEVEESTDKKVILWIFLSLTPIKLRHIQGLDFIFGVHKIYVIAHHYRCCYFRLTTGLEERNSVVRRGLFVYCFHAVLNVFMKAKSNSLFCSISCRLCDPILTGNYLELLLKLSRMTFC